MAMGQLIAEKLRLGKIGFLNVLPLYYPLETGVVPNPFDIVSGTPAHLNELMARGELDLSVVSSIEYARHFERYFLLPDLSISCNGAVRSVLLLSRAPFRDLAESPIMVTTQSHTSAALLEIIFSIRLGIRAEYIPGNATEALDRGDSPVAFLTIGDEALRLAGREDYPYRMDLGEAWRRWTGLPFVFATWIVQRKAVDRWNGHFAEAMGSLFAAKRWGCEHMELVCAEAVSRGAPLSREGLCAYYRGLSFDLREEQQKGLELFYRYLVEIGRIREVPPLDIFSPLAGAA